MEIPRHQQTAYSSTRHTKKFAKIQVSWPTVQLTLLLAEIDIIIIYEKHIQVEIRKGKIRTLV